MTVAGAPPAAPVPNPSARNPSARNRSAWNPSAGTAGPLEFARFAYPPNALGHCGPDAAGQLLEQVGERAVDGDLRALLRGFDGAWPYLELIAAAARIGDPLDARVVEAYWIGNDLLDRVGTAPLGRSLEQRFRGRAGRSWSDLAAAIPAGAVPHHSVHVLAVYPWVGLLRAGHHGAPLMVLDRCRVRWGRVEQVVGGSALVRCQPLEWNGHALTLGPPQLEQAQVAAAGHQLAPALRPGSWCALHWDWVCTTLDPRRLAALRSWSARTLALVNALPHPGPAAVLG